MTRLKWIHLHNNLKFLIENGLSFFYYYLPSTRSLLEYSGYSESLLQPLSWVSLHVAATTIYCGPSRCSFSHSDTDGVSCTLAAFRPATLTSLRLDSSWPTDWRELNGGPARTPISDRPLRFGAADAAAARAHRCSPRSRRSGLRTTIPPHQVAHSAATVRLRRRDERIFAYRRRSASFRCL